MFNFSDILGLVDNLQGTIVGNALGLKDEEKEKISIEIQKFKQNVELEEIKWKKEYARLKHEKDLAIINNSDKFVRHWYIYKQILKYALILVIILLFYFNPEFMDRVAKFIDKMASGFMKLPEGFLQSLMFGGTFGAGAIINNKISKRTN